MLTQGYAACVLTTDQPDCAPERPRRARPLAPDDRREAVLRATVPLLLDRGLAVSTRELAEAAGVAEGTLFRVFPDKASLVRAAVDRALDPEPLVGRIGRLPAGSPDDVVGSVVALLLDQVREVHGLVTLVHATAAHGEHHARPHGGAHEHVAAVVAAVAEALEPHRDRLRRDPAVCARLLVGLVLAVSGPLRVPTPGLDAADVAELFCVGSVLEEPSC